MTHLGLEERRWYVAVGLDRVKESRRRGCCNKHGYSCDDPLARDIAAAGAELAAAEALGVAWPAGVNTDKGPDLATRTQVRHTELVLGSLLVRPADPDDHIYVLVTGAEPDFMVRGWLWGHEIKQPVFLKNLANGRPPCWLAPQHQLRPLSELEGLEK